MKKVVIYLILVIYSFVVGCREEVSNSSVSKSKPYKYSDLESVTNEVTYFDLPINSVLVVVGTNKLTKAEFNSFVELRKRMAELSIPKGQNRKVNRLAIEAPMLASITNFYPLQCVLLDYAARNKISVKENEYKAFRNNFKRSCKSEFKSWNNFIKDFSTEEQKLIDERVQAEALISAVRKSFFDTNPVNITTQEVEVCQKRLEDYHKRASATNDLIWARASNIWNKVSNGMNFEMAANRYTEDENEPEDGEWGEFLLGDFNEERELQKCISQLIPGQITPPIEGDNGLMILKLVSKDEDIAKNNEGIVEPLKVRYNLSRIFFRLPVFYEKATFDEIWKSLRDVKEKKAFSLFVDKLKSDVSIDFPSGTKIFEQARRMANMPMMLQQDQ